MSETEEPIEGAEPAQAPQGDLSGTLVSWLTGLPKPVLKAGGLVLGIMAVQFVANGFSFQSSPRRRRR